MPTVKDQVKQGDFYQDGLISDKVKDRGNDPFFVKKAEHAKEFISKHPIPKHLLNIQDKK